MAKVTLAQLGEMLRSQRGGRGIREAAAEIGVSAATLSRVERGNLPDLATFGKVCKWLRVDPAEVLGIGGSRHSPQQSQATPIVATAHFRADQTTSPELARAMAELILAAQRMLSERT